MKLLSICIPNYNRLEKLENLLSNIAETILKNNLQEKVEICISDDCSKENPIFMFYEKQKEYPNITMHYRYNKINMGMDYNFLQSVFLAESNYCWIIGNDDEWDEW